MKMGIFWLTNCTYFPGIINFCQPWKIPIMIMIIVVVIEVVVVVVVCLFVYYYYCYYYYYIADAEYVYEDMKQEMKAKLMALANSACSYLHDKRYMKSPWLCNLNWTSKKFRGKAITKKSDKIKLLTAIEDFYEKQENEFLENTGESGGKEKAEFIISSMESKIPQRAVHMPGYPELVGSRFSVF